MKNDKTWINDIFKFDANDADKTGAKIVSFSQAGKFYSCPRAWKIRYIDKIKDDAPSMSLVFGNAMHEVVQTWIKVTLSKSVKLGDTLDFSSMLKNQLKELYLADVEKYGSHFSTPSELSEYYADGIATLEFLRKKRTKFFNSKTTKILAIELPINIVPDPSRPKVVFTGFIDVVLYDVSKKSYRIIDIKTSNRGWNEYTKKDKHKTDQILLYKRYFAKQYDVNEDDIEVEFVILKRKINEDSVWPSKRVQYFSPASGKPSCNKADKAMVDFINYAFTPDGQYNIDAEYPAHAGPNGWNCTFCVYSGDENLCPKEKRKNTNFEI